MPDDQIFPSCHWETAGLVASQRDPRWRRAAAAALPLPVDAEGLLKPIELRGSSQSVG